MELKFGDKLVHTCGELPEIGKTAPEFTLINPDLKRVSLTDFKNKPVLLNIFPSIDTKVCSASVNYFNKQITKYPDLVVLCISVDTPFAMKRHCIGFDYENVVLLSDFQQRAFGKAYGLTVIDSEIAGVLARAVLILDKDHQLYFRYACQDVSQTVEFQLVEKALNNLFEL
jgi:thiol peroxidase